MDSKPFAGKRGAGLAALLLVFAAGAIFLAACAAPGPPRRGELPPAPPLPSVSPAPSPVSRPESAVTRPVRVRMEEKPAALLLRGESMRVWNAGGSLIAMENGDVRVRTSGDRIGWGESTLFESPIDVWAPGGLKLEGRRLPGRIRISAQNGGIRVVAVVPLEEYVAAVLSREAAPSFHPEALSALAVAVRTYTLIAIAAPRDPDYDLVAGVDDQVFEGIENIAEGFRKAAEATRGEVLYYRDGLARAVYHSTCGGRTENAAAAWGTDFPYLRSVWCDDCRESPAWRWEYRMSRAEGARVAHDLGLGAGGGLRIEITTRTTTGRARQVRLAAAGTAREVKASSFRRAAGYARVKSLRMEIAPSGDGWKFSGSGYGHGVGMCQWGADGMAKRGAGYREILARYYLLTRVAILPGGIAPFAMNPGGAP